MNIAEAVDSGNIKKVEECIALNNEEIDNFVITRAAQAGYFEIVKLLVGSGGKINDNAVAHAAEVGHFEIAKWLLENGGKINVHAVSYAVSSGNLNLIKFLVKNGGRIAYSAVANAEKAGHSEIAKWLLENGGKRENDVEIKEFNSNILSFSDCHTIADKNRAVKVKCGERSFFTQQKSHVETVLSELIGSKISQAILGAHRVDNVLLMQREKGIFSCASQEIPNFHTISVSWMDNDSSSGHRIGIEQAFNALKKNELTNPGFILASNNKTIKSLEDLMVVEAFVSHHDMHQLNVGIVDIQDSQEVELAVIDFDKVNLHSHKASGYDRLWNSYKYSLNIHKLIESIDKILSTDVGLIIEKTFKEYFYDNAMYAFKTQIYDYRYQDGSLFYDEDLSAQEQSILEVFESRKKDFATLKARLTIVESLINNTTDVNSVIKDLDISIHQDLFYDIIGIRYYSLFDVCILLNRSIDIFNIKSKDSSFEHAPSFPPKSVDFNMLISPTKAPDEFFNFSERNIISWLKVGDLLANSIYNAGIVCIESLKSIIAPIGNSHTSSFDNIISNPHGTMPIEHKINVIPNGLGGLINIIQDTPILVSEELFI